MSSLKNKIILSAGAGEMGLKLLTEFLKRDDISKNKITVVTGASPGKNMPAVIKHLTKEKLDLNGITFSQYNTLNTANISSPDILILNVDPKDVNQALKLYEPIIDKNSTKLISMVAGHRVKKYTKYFERENIARIMPQQSKGICAVYSSNPETAEIAKSIASGLGRTSKISHEENLHPFSAVAGAGPAFIANFLKSFATEDEKETTKRIQKAKEYLSFYAKGQKPPKPKVQDLHIGIKCSRFYDNFIKVSQEFFNVEDAQNIVNDTLESSLKDVSTDSTQASLDEYISKVRNPGGITNTGLLFAGSPPHGPKFGDDTYMVAQEMWAEKYRNLFSPEEAIIPAVLAANKRSKAVSEGKMDPLGGVDWGYVEKETKKIKLKQITETITNIVSR